MSTSSVNSAASNGARSVVSGADALDRIISPMTAAEFMERLWEKQFYHGVGAAGRYVPIFSWDVLSRVLSEHRFQSSRLRLFRQSTMIRPSIYQNQPYSLVRPAETIRELQNGATLIIDCVEEVHQPLRDLAAGLQSLLRSPVFANLYAAWRQDHGFDVHFDMQENIVIQVAGRKNWQVWRPTRPFPLKPDVEAAPKPNTPPDWEGVLEDGSWLYIPRGWWHVAYPINEPSLHITITIVPFTGFDFLTWVAERCRASSAVRQNLPAVQDRDGHGKFLEALETEIRNHLTSGSIDQFLKERQGVDVRFGPSLRLPSLDLE
jgi:ribosomal protein L16 Arg81 hydroxylase